MNLSRFSLEIDLWILTALRKTPTTRFPPILGRRQQRAAHRLNRLYSITLETEAGHPRTRN